MTIGDYEGIVVFGVPRSGTTLLRRLLNAHPEITCPPETNIFPAASAFLDEYASAGGLRIGVIPGLEFAGFSPDDVLTRLREFVFGILHAIAQRENKRIWAEKTAVSIFHLAPIVQLCGDRCRYVGIVRHPLDTICSIKELVDKMGTYMPELHQYVRRHEAPYVAFAHAWNDGNTALLQRIEQDPARWHLLRYEDLVESPERELNRLFDRLELQTDIEALLSSGFQASRTVGLGDWKTFSTASIEQSRVGRRASLDSWTVATVAPIVRDTAQALGYPPIAIPRVLRGGDETRIRALSSAVARLKMETTLRPPDDETSK